jgi:hypothetical protein
MKHWVPSLLLLGLVGCQSHARLKPVAAETITATYSRVYYAAPVAGTRDQSPSAAAVTQNAGVKSSKTKPSPTPSKRSSTGPAVPKASGSNSTAETQRSFLQRLFGIKPNATSQGSGSSAVTLPKTSKPMMASDVQSGHLNNSTPAQTVKTPAGRVNGVKVSAISNRPPEIKQNFFQKLFGIKPRPAVVNGARSSAAKSQKIPKSPDKPDDQSQNFIETTETTTVISTQPVVAPDSMIPAH